MTDYFEELELPRSAALSADVVRERFQELSRTRHPDADGDDEGFARLNDAQRVLSQPGSRMRHLLELEFGDAATEAIRQGAMGDSLMTLFGSVGPVLQRADDFFKRRAAAKTAIARAMLAREEIEVQQALMAIGGEIGAYRSGLELRLAGLDEAGSLDLAVGAALCREFQFVDKWRREVQARIGAMLS